MTARPPDPPENANGPGDDRAEREELRLFPDTNTEQRAIKLEIFEHLKLWLATGDHGQLRLAKSKGNALKEAA